jgi:hypothetical protein
VVPPEVPVVPVVVPVVLVVLPEVVLGAGVSSSSSQALTRAIDEQSRAPIRSEVHLRFIKNRILG